MSILNKRNRSEYAFPLATQSNEIQLKYYEQHGLTLSAPEKPALQKMCIRDRAGTMNREGLPGVIFTAACFTPYASQHKGEP